MVVSKHGFYPPPQGLSHTSPNLPGASLVSPPIQPRPLRTEMKYLTCDVTLFIYFQLEEGGLPLSFQDICKEQNLNKSALNEISKFYNNFKHHLYRNSNPNN